MRSQWSHQTCDKPVVSLPYTQVAHLNRCEWGVCAATGGTGLCLGKAVRLPPAPSWGSQDRSHLVLARVYVLLFQQKLRRRGKRTLIWAPAERGRVENTLQQRKALYGGEALAPSSLPAPQRPRQGLGPVTTEKGWAWVTEGGRF